MQETVTKLLQSKLPFFLDRFSSEIESATDFRGDLEIVVAPGKIREMVTFLKTNGEMPFEIMMDIFGVDYLKFNPETPERFAVIYNLYSLSRGRRVRLKVFLSEDKPEIDSLCDVYKMADWFERETWDMYGIVFRGHPNLVRILCHNEFVGYPLRKDYPADQYQRLKTAATSSEF